MYGKIMLSACHLGFMAAAVLKDWTRLQSWPDMELTGSGFHCYTCCFAYDCTEAWHTVCERGTACQYGLNT